MQGKRIAIYGLGRSGLAITRAALSLGAIPIVYDRARADQMAKQDTLEAAHDLGVEIHLGWEGRFDPLRVDMLVTNPSVDMRSPILQDAKTAGIEILSEIEFAYRISKAPIVAITGTNGKSTTTVMTYLALRECGVDAVLCGNVFGTGYNEVPLTEAAMNSTPDQVLVAEVSSFQLEWVSEFRPIAGAITNIAPDHLDRYDSFEQYAETKLRIFAAQKDGDYAVLPDLSARDAAIDNDRIRILDRTIPIADLSVVGKHNYRNIVVAGLLAVAVLERKSGGKERVPPCLVEALVSFRGIEHRMELVGFKNGVQIINNSMCTNPAAVVASAESLDGRIHFLMGGKDKDLPFEPVRNHLERCGDIAYLYGEAKEVLNSQLGGCQRTYNTLQDAFWAATEQAKPGETIMLAPGCASMDQFHDFRDRGNVFKKIAKEWLES